jgi:hypothetical protein
LVMGTVFLIPVCLVGNDVPHALFLFDFYGRGWWESGTVCRGQVLLLLLL